MRGSAYIASPSRVSVCINTVAVVYDCIKRDGTSNLIVLGSAGFVGVVMARS